MLLNASADWSTGEINVRGDMVDHFWTPDIIIHDLVSFYKPEILNQVAALEIKKWKQLYFKVRYILTLMVGFSGFGHGRPPSKAQYPFSEVVDLLAKPSYIWPFVGMT
jgi:hypothetical protein